MKDSSRRPSRPKAVQRQTQRSEPGRIRIMLVDDHPMWRDTVRVVLEGSGTGEIIVETSDGVDVVPLASEANPDVVIMDMGLPSVGGGAATRALVRAFPGVHVLVLSASDDRATVLSAVDAGARGYLLKTAEPEQVVEAVQRVHRGELVFPPSLSGLVLDELRTRADAAVTQRTRYRVVVADASVLGREGLARILGDADLDVVATASGSDELLRIVGSSRPDIVVLDTAMPPVRINAEELHPAVALRRSNPHVGILLLASAIDVSSAMALLDSGTTGAGYMLKNRLRDIEHLGDAIQRVGRGESAIDPDVFSELIAFRSERDPLSGLTGREREVLALMAEGRSNQAIGERLFLTPKTVEAHVRSIFTKLGLEPALADHRRVLAVLMYVRSA